MNVKEFLSRHGSTILTFISAAAMVGTVAETIKDTKKALDRIEEAKAEKHAELTKFETVQVAVPSYIPAIVLGTLTIACTFGANVLNKKQQASLMSAYALLNETYKKHKDKFSKYRSKVTELFGEEAGLKTLETVSEEEHPVPENIDIEKKQQFVIHIDGEEPLYFTSTVRDVLNARYEFEKKMFFETYASVKDFTDILGVDCIQNGKLLGWNIWAIEEWNGYPWVDIEVDENEDGMLEVYFINDPTPGYEDYEENLAYMEHMYLEAK